VGGTRWPEVNDGRHSVVASWSRVPSGNSWISGQVDGTLMPCPMQVCTCVLWNLTVRLAAIIIESFQSHNPTLWTFKLKAEGYMMAAQADPVPCLLSGGGAWPAWIVRHASQQVYCTCVWHPRRSQAGRVCQHDSNQHLRGMLLNQVYSAAGMQKQWYTGSSTSKTKVAVADLASET